MGLVVVLRVERIAGVVRLELAANLPRIVPGAKQRIIHTREPVRIELPAPLNTALDRFAQLLQRRDLSALQRLAPRLLGQHAWYASPFQLREESLASVAQTGGSRTDVMPGEFGVVHVTGGFERGQRLVNLARFVTESLQLPGEFGASSRPAPQ